MRIIEWTAVGMKVMGRGPVTHHQHEAQLLSIQLSGSLSIPGYLLSSHLFGQRKYPWHDSNISERLLFAECLICLFFN